MCGIAGHLSFPTADPEAVLRMTEALRHRGPDGEGFHHVGPIALGHRRLAIIDLATGNQPIFNEDRTLAIVFNGEIYNYRELARDLRARHTFKTESDTEVLLHLYEDEGPDMLEKLRGMFAFAIWDAHRRRLFAARDPFGKKPFLYCERAGRLWFASEMGALRASGAPVGEVDRAALSDYLELLYVPAPRSIFQNVRKLPPGHYLLADERGLATHRYFTPPVPGSARDRIPTPAAVRVLLEESVRLRLRSDVPIAALLSGGIDSSAVVALMAQEVGPGVKTFSVGFGRGDDELPFAQQIAEMYRTEHHELFVTSDAVTQTAETLSTYSEPFGDSSAVPAVAVCREVARHVKVVLTGDGGDELFAGYGRYRMLHRLPQFSPVALAEPVLARLPRSRRLSSLRRAVAVIGARGGRRNRALVEVFSLAERRALLGDDVRVAAGIINLPDDVDSALAFDLGVYLPDDLLVKMDIASMHWGLEVRCPLLDHVLAREVIPPAVSAKQTGHDTKLLLKKALGALLPPEILSRKKRGFGSPVEAWLRGPLRPLLEDLLRAPSAKVRAWFPPRCVDRVVDDAVTGRGNAHQAWALLALEGWARRQVS